MRYVTTLTLTLLLLAPTVQARSLCGEKEQDIQREINHAEQHNNPHRVAGLTTALNALRAHCTDSKLIAEHQDKITQQKAKVAERQTELDKARRKGDAEKVIKRERKLAEAEYQLKSLEARQY